MYKYSLFAQLGSAGCIPEIVFFYSYVRGPYTRALIQAINIFSLNLRGRFNRIGVGGKR